MTYKILINAKQGVVIVRFVHLLNNLYDMIGKCYWEFLLDKEKGTAMVFDEDGLKPHLTDHVST